MRIVESIMNGSEELVFRELENIASDNGLRVFPKLRFSDVVQKGKSFLTQREFDFYTRSHFDFTITDADKRPLMIVEYDGPRHEDTKQVERDQIKNALCKQAGLGLLRIHDRHVTKLYRGMTVLRWIIEVVELEKAFYEAQDAGQIPADEPFSPIFLEPAGDGGRWHDPPGGGGNAGERGGGKGREWGGVMVGGGGRRPRRVGCRGGWRGAERDGRCAAALGQALGVGGCAPARGGVAGSRADICRLTGWDAATATDVLP
ncbi:DUF2726 domain-containing protein [Paracoccus sp. (in: a-proteobacteria)]|uniref:DUF2726 domain-containing protein n=1 Tax=Paracoccus sp. TaxID=267 RepID=UPI002AFF2542|nr:DUF2726 domain-containing protein [Paracoccus sp. (in: a-proteobacteria)]